MTAPDPATGSDRQTIRSVMRWRARRLGPSEASYRVYMAAMLTIIVVAPAVRVLVLWLAGVLPAPGVSGETASLEGALAAALTTTTAVLVLSGAIGGPALTTLPKLDLLFITPIPRRRLFQPQVVASSLWGACAGVCLAGLLLGARAVQGDLDPGSILAVLLSGAGLGAIGAGALLFGQWGRRARGALSGALALLAVVQLGLGPLLDPWSVAARFVFAADSDRSATSALLALVPVAVGLGVVCCAPWIAGRLRWEALREQAGRWDTVRVLAVTGDPSAALVRLGAPVRWGRRMRLRLPRGAGLTAVLLCRDALGIVRAPGRSLAAFGAVAGAGALWMLALSPGSSADPVRAAVLGAVAFTLVYLGMQPWCRGLATAAAGSGSAPLLPVSPAGLLVRHLVAPAVGCLIALAVGASTWVLGGLGVGHATPAGTDLIWACMATSVLGAVALLLRLVATLKGPIPMKLLAPIPTPVGDASGINVLMWTLDGPLCAVLLGMLLAVVWALGISGGAPVAACAVSALCLVGLTVWARTRLGSGRA